MYVEYFMPLGTASFSSGKIRESGRQESSSIHNHLFLWGKNAFAGEVFAFEINSVWEYWCAYMKGNHLVRLACVAFTQFCGAFPTLNHTLLLCFDAARSRRFARCYDTSDMKLRPIRDRFGAKLVKYVKA